MLNPTECSSNRFWHLRFWDGMRVLTWLRILARNRFDIDLLKIPGSLIISGMSIVNTGLWAAQQLLWGRRIDKTEIREAPVFILGHWRSGTTLLHEYLALDPQFTYPTTYQCFAPNHFLLTERFLPFLLKLLMPAYRPMDNMAAGFDHPQEDEFALCNMGLPSPYLYMLFPRRKPPHPEYLDLVGLSSVKLEQWKAGLLRFLKAITLRTPKRIVLKSPPHTARIRVLRELFPDARFIHIVRNPYVVFPSTLKLWQCLSEVEGLQHPPAHGLKNYVFETFNRMYTAFDHDRPAIPSGHFTEVRYEDLVMNPLTEIARIYQELKLGGFDTIRPALESSISKGAEYQTNQFQITPDLRAEIDRHWGYFIRRYGYDQYL
jgi:omega-hydroxy-beta-dihydromenaquinone-9 sulfotransferase